jgi:hypothetical protein
LRRAAKRIKKRAAFRLPLLEPRTQDRGATGGGRGAGAGGDRERGAGPPPPPPRTRFLCVRKPLGAYLGVLELKPACGHPGQISNTKLAAAICYLLAMHI